MSAEALPITAARFREAIADLPLSSLHLKASELLNSLKHLKSSNEQLAPFANPPPGSSEPADEVCAEAIKENEEVMKRHEERLVLLREEAEKRNVGWGQLLGGDVGDLPEAYLGEALAGVQAERDAAARAQAQGQSGGERHQAWSDGTFTTGRIEGSAWDQEVVVVDGNGNLMPEVTGVADAVPRTVNGNADRMVNGTGTTQGGRLSDEELRRRLAEQMGEDEDGGMHL